LENLKSALTSVYKLVRENNRESYATNKRYYDRRANERGFDPGDLVYLFNPVKKRGQCSKFWSLWVGPFKIVALLSRLNYRIMNQKVNESVVHVNRLQRAYKQGSWKAKEKERCYRKQRKGRQEPEDESAVLAPGPLSIPAHQVENRQPVPRSPKGSSPRALQTPATERHHLDGPGSQRAVPNYVPPDIPRSRRELGTTRQDPPVTLLRSRHPTRVTTKKASGRVNKRG
jgi:hypothetical protein